MWVMTLDGFYSAVEHTEDVPDLLVRTRDTGDAVRLANWLALHGAIVDIKHTPEADYAYRMTVSREKWGEYLTARAHDIDYPNFKSAIAERQGKRRAVIYANVWVELLALQDPKGR